MKKGAFIIFSLLAILLVVLLFKSSRTTLSYSATCLACLQEVGGVEKSVLGITYSHMEKQRRRERGGFISYTDGIRIAPIDPRVYQEIAGHPCKHTFVRTGFCRYRSGSIGCGHFGGQRHEFRKELMVNLYRGYVRVPDQSLARETLAMIDRFYPISPAKNPASTGLRPPIEVSFQVDSLPNEPLSILYRGLAMISNAAEWRQVLDAANAGDGSLKLLVDPVIMARRLDNPDPGIRRQVIDQLAALKDPGAWATIAGCLKDPDTREHAARTIVFAGQLQYFEAVFQADEETRARKHYKEDDPVGYTPEIFDHLIVKYSAEEIRSLFVQRSPYLDQLGFAAIRRQQRFEFLEEVLAFLNERPSPFAVRAIESLLQGPTPFEVGMRFSDLPRLDPWTKLVAQTNMNPVESLTNYTELGKITILKNQRIVRLGLQKDPAKWGELRDLYIDSIPQLGGEETTAAIAQAMAESDRARTLDFLLSQLDLDFSRKEQTVAAIAGLGAIADASSLVPLLAFSGKNIADGMSIYGHSSYKPFIDYALHRCRGIHRWRLVKGSGSNYRIEKPGNDE
jgi:hypothetical protein